VLEQQRAPHRRGARLRDRAPERRRRVALREALDPQPQRRVTAQDRGDAREPARGGCAGELVGPASRWRSST